MFISILLFPKRLISRFYISVELSEDSSGQLILSTVIAGKSVSKLMGENADMFFFFFFVFSQ